MRDGLVADGIVAAEGEAAEDVQVGAGTVAMGAAIAAGVAFLLGLVRLGAPSLWFDEAYTARVVEETPRFWIESDQYHFLYDALVSGWAAAAGSSEWALRLPSVIAAACAAALMVVLADRMRLDRWVGLAAGLLLATSPFVVMWSQQARSYTFLLLLCLVSTLLLLRALDRGTQGAWALYGLSISVVVVWHAAGGLLLVPSHAVLIAQRRERFKPHGLLAIVIATIVAIPWAATIVLRTSGEGAGIAWLQAPSAATMVHALADTSGAAGLGALLSVAGLTLLLRSGRSRLAVWLSTWAVSPALLALLVTTVRPVFLDRYLIVAAPAFALLAGVAVVETGRRVGPLLALAAATASAVALLSWYSTASDGNWRGEDWRSAVSALRAVSGGSEVVVVPWWANLAAAYYGATPSSVSTSDTVWVLTWSETGHALPRGERASLGFGEHRIVSREDFGRRVSLQHWVRTG